MYEEHGTRDPGQCKPAGILQSCGTAILAASQACIWIVQQGCFCGMSHATGTQLALQQGVMLCDTTVTASHSHV